MLNLRDSCERRAPSSAIPIHPGKYPVFRSEENQDNKHIERPDEFHHSSKAVCLPIQTTIWGASVYLQAVGSGSETLMPNALKARNEAKIEP